MMDFFGIKLKDPGVSQIENVKLETLPTQPTTQNFVGRIYFNSTDSKFYYCTNAAGSGTFVAFTTGSDASALQSEVDALETSLGAGVLPDGTFVTSAFAGTYTTGATSFTDAIMKLDGALNSNNTLAELDDVSFSSLANKDILYYDSANSLWKNSQAGATAGVQPYDATLTALAGVTTAADKLIYATGSDTFATTDFTSFARTLLDDADAATARSTLGVVIGTNVQAYDAGLASLAGLNASAGDMIYATGPDAYTLTASTSYGRGFLNFVDEAAFKAGVNLEIGVDVQAYDAGLAALASFNTNGILVQTADNTFAGRTIATASSSRVTVSNGDGVSGNPTLDLATVTDAGTGTFLKITRDSYGRVSGTTAVVLGDVTALVDPVYVKIAGDTMAGALHMNNNTLDGLVSPTASDQAATKGYVDAAMTGLSWKNAVRVATTANVAISTGLENGDTVDDVTLATGDRVLVKNQTNPEENGIYIVAASGAAARASDMDAAAEFDGAAVFVKEGSINQNTGWTQVNTVATVGTDPVSWQQFSGGAVYTWGTGLNNTGNQVYINLGAGIVELPSDEVGIDVHSSGGLFLTTDNSTSSSAAAAQIAVKIDGSTLSKSGSGLKVADGGITMTQLAGTALAGAALVVNGSAFDVNVDNSTIEINSDALRVKAAGITSNELGTDSVITAKIQNAAVTEGKLAASVAGAGLSGGAGSALAVNVDNSTIEINTDTLRVKDAGITNAKLANSGFNLHGDAGSDDVASLGETINFYGTGGASTTISGNTVTVGLSSNLSTISGATATAGNTLVGNGTNFVSKKIMHKTALLSAATSHVVTHSLNQRLVLVQVYDSSYNQIIPDNILLDSTTQCTISFGSNSVSCYVVVVGIEGA